MHNYEISNWLKTPDEALIVDTTETLESGIDADQEPRLASIIGPDDER